MLNISNDELKVKCLRRFCELLRHIIIMELDGSFKQASGTAKTFRKLLASLTLRKPEEPYGTMGNLRDCNMSPAFGNIGERKVIFQYQRWADIN